MDGNASDLIGKVVGGCRIDRLLGSGAMGAVYQGVHLALQKPVAVKIMSARLASDQQYIQRFLTEARLAAQIEHPNIVQVLNVGNAGPLHFIVMQYVEGESVASLMARLGPLPPLEAARIALGIARGLAAAHAKGIIHRDIKPANVLLTYDGEAKVADLGLAKAVSGESDTQLTQFGETMGTPQYMPPEQAEDARTADTRSDIYSLGCSLYHMLAGNAPFSGPTAVSIIQKHMTAAVPHISAQRPGIPEPLSALITRMMAKKREDRPQSMDEVVAVLEGIAGQRVGAPAPPKKWFALAIGAAAAVLLLILVAALRISPAEMAYSSAQTHWENNLDDYDGAIADFEKVAQQFPGTKWAQRAEESAKSVKAAREKAAAAAFEQTSKAAAQANHYRQAIRLWDDFPKALTVGEYAEKVRAAKQKSREQAAQANYERTQHLAQAATEARDYAKALLLWDEFPKDLLVGDHIEKVRTARLKARLPMRVESFLLAIEKPDNLGPALQYLEPEELNAKGREPMLGLLRLLRGGAAIFVDIEGWELKGFEFSPDLASCNVSLTLKLLNKFNKQRERKDDHQPWILYKDEWYLRLKPPALPPPPLGK